MTVSLGVGEAGSCILGRGLGTGSDFGERSGERRWARLRRATARRGRSARRDQGGGEVVEELPFLVEDSDDTLDAESKASQEDRWIRIGSNTSYGVSSADWGVNEDG